MRRDESGMIVVETVGSFFLFVFLIISILSLVNIVTLQARVHYAATQAATTVSMYSYVLEVTGIAGVMQGIEGRAAKARDTATEFVEELSEMRGAMQSFELAETKDSFDNLVGIAGDELADPMELLSKFVNLGISEISHFVFGEAMRSLMGRYLSNALYIYPNEEKPQMMSGGAYLTSVNVVGGLSGLSFYDLNLSVDDDSVLLTEDGDVVIVVKYSIDYTFGALPLPFSELEVTHVVKTKAWLGGSGEGYKWD